MSVDSTWKIGLIVGDESEWTDAFIQGVNAGEHNVTVELVKLGGTFMDEGCEYAVIIDRMSHEIPYYRAFLKYAIVQGAYVINNPFTMSTDSKFFGTGLATRLGLRTPRTAVLPNKQVEQEFFPDSFRNLKYPMDWNAVITYVGVPAILKDNHTGGRRRDYRVHDVNDLLERYDESGTRTMVLQQFIDSENHVHAFVIGQERVLLLRYLVEDGRYHPQVISYEEAEGSQLAADALKITRAYKYDINMVEFVIDGAEPYLINGTNPAPVINTNLMTSEQFDWLVQAIVDLAVARVRKPLKQYTIFKEMLGP